MLVFLGLEPSVPPGVTPFVTIRSIIPFNDLFALIMFLAVAVSMMVLLILGYLLARFRARDDEAIPEQSHGNRRLEIAWTAIPALIIAALFTYMLIGMFQGPTPGNVGAHGQDPDIIVIGHQWWWEVRYPKNGNVVTANEVHIPVGKRLIVNLTSADVQHTFWVPQLSQKMDLIPGHINYIYLDAAAAGNYQGACAEFCGLQHAGMRILLVAEPQAQFDAWLAAQRGAAQVPSSDPQVQRGQQVFSQSACANCHAIAGTAYAGNAAPDLTNFSTRQTIASGVLPHTPANLKRFLRDPQAVKPGVQMPNFRLNDADLDALVAYLESLK